MSVKGLSKREVDDTYPVVYRTEFSVEVMRGKSRITIKGRSDEVCLVRAWLSSRVPGLRVLTDSENEVTFESREDTVFVVGDKKIEVPGLSAL